MNDGQPMDWDNLRFVLGLARAGTLSLAADGLGVTHTTVSRRIKAFETSLGVRLFDRRPEGWVLTAAGEELAAAAEAMEVEVHRLDRKLLGADNRLSGTVRIATLDSFAGSNPELFVALRDAYPRIDLEVTVATRFVDLTRREADIAIRWTTGSPPPHLVGRKVGAFEYAVYGAKSLVEQMPPGAPLDTYPWLTWDPRLGARQTAEWMRTHVPKARIAMYLDSAAVMMGALRGGVGIAHQVCQQGDVDDRLVRLRGVEPGWGVDGWLLTHPDLRHVARIRAVIDFLYARLVEMRPRFSGALGVDPDPMPPLTAG